MITPMRKLFLLCQSKDVDDALLALRRVGVVHVTEERPPASSDLEHARHNLESIRRALEILPKRAHAHPQDAPLCEINEVVESLRLLAREHEEYEERYAALHQERKDILPLGRFNPADVLDLEEHGLLIRLFRTSRRNAPDDLVDSPNDAVTAIIHQGKSSRTFAVLAFAEPTVRAIPVPLPKRPLSEVEQEMADLVGLMRENQRLLASCAYERPTVQAAFLEAQEHVRFLEIRDAMHMEPDAGLAWLQGYFPARDENKVLAAAQENGWGYAIEEPTSLDTPPTLLQTPTWARPIRPVFKLLGVTPGYNESDPGAVVLLFLSLFFGLLVGDAGYGLIFMLLSLGVLAFKNAVPQAREAGALLLIMSASAMAIGALSGVYFGMQRFTGLPGMLVLPALASEFAQQNMMLLCFFLGAVHLSLARLWRAALLFPSPRFLAQCGWALLIWGMFYAARLLVLRHPFPAPWLWASGLGLLLIALFMTPPAQFRAAWFQHAMLPLDVIGVFVDVVSYIRLFAVGAATLAMGAAFNAMAGALVGADSGIFMIIGAGVLLFFGHALNLLLACMGVLVHGVRLNMLEFGRHLDLGWGGHAYAPFAQHSETNESKAEEKTWTS